MERESIDRLLASGDAKAQIDFGRRMEREGQHNVARAFFATAARNGTLEGLRLLGVSLMTAPPFNPGEGMNIVKAAAEQGDGEALHFCAIIASQDETLKDRHAIALRYLARASEKNFTLAQATLKLLSGTQSTDWHASAKSADLAVWTLLPPSRTLNESPRMEVFEGFLSPALCDWLVSRAAPRLKIATVYNPQTGDQNLKSDSRTNTTAQFPIAEADILLMMTQARITKLTGLAVPQLEPPVVLHYDVGEEFAPHFDYLDPAMPALADELRERGQRVATFLIYLNDGFEGGETDFPTLNMKFKGKKGDAILFWNVDPNGVPDERTYHAGLPPLSGEKWLFSQWLRAPRA